MCSKSISIAARSNKDYFPQLGPNGENIQEFICPTTCPAVSNILGLDADGTVASDSDFMQRRVATHSIRSSRIFGRFHPEKVVELVELDEFVMLPIDTRHAPGQNGAGKNADRNELVLEEPPRYFCLFYCELGRSADAVHHEDIELIKRCLGNMIFNTFSRRRHDIIEKLTIHLADILDDDSSFLLDHLVSDSLPSRSIFKVTVNSLRDETLKIEGSSRNRGNLSHEDAKRIWDVVPEDCNQPVNISKPQLPKDSGTVRSILVWQRQGETKRERTMYFFCDKVSHCPLHGAEQHAGLENFEDHFGFDDAKLLDEIGAHIRAFTETSEGRSRRTNSARILAHESSSPFFDIRNLLSKHKEYPTLLPWEEASELIENAARLGLAMVKMNTEMTDEKLSRIRAYSDTTTVMLPALQQLKRTLLGVCKDVRFLNDNIEVVVGPGCRTLPINMDVLQTIFINTVTNSIKYANKNLKVKERWCTFRIMRMYSPDDQSWHGFSRQLDQRRSGLLISATDNGIGISDAEKHLVFEQEWQSSNRDVAKGLGLGLWHVRRIVEALDGDIWVQSGSDLRPETNEKTRVSVLLPFRF